MLDVYVVVGSLRSSWIASQEFHFCLSLSSRNNTYKYRYNHMVSSSTHLDIFGKDKECSVFVLIRGRISPRLGQTVTVGSLPRLFWVRVESL